MPRRGDTEDLSHHRRNHLCAEDYIIIIVIVTCLIIPVVMLGVSQIYPFFSPPAVLAIFFGIAVASILYRFLGGTDGANLVVGALKVTGSAAVLIGVSIWTDSRLTEQLNNYDELKQTQSKLEQTEKALEKNKQKLLTLEVEVKDITEAQKLLEDELKVVNEENFRLKNDLPKTVHDLLPELPISKGLRDIQIKKQGPWRPFSNSFELKVSIVDYLPEGRVASCQEHVGKRIEVISNYEFNGEPVTPLRPVVLDVNDYINRTTKCKDLKYDLHITCPDAVKIFSNSVLTCDEKNIAKWKNNAEFLPVNAVYLYD